MADTSIKKINYRDHIISICYDEYQEHPKEVFDESLLTDKLIKAWENGENYGYIVDGKLCNDSCWGFYGNNEIDYMIKEAKESINYAIKQENEAIEFVNNAFAL